MANDAEPGRVECIHFAISEGEPMLATARIRVLAGIGLEGDRYATGRGHFSGMPGTGGVLCEGKRLCEPCRYLEGVVSKPLLDPLSHRGGLRADVLEDGEIRIGDELRPVEQ